MRTTRSVWCDSKRGISTVRFRNGVKRSPSTLTTATQRITSHGFLQQAAIEASAMGTKPLLSRQGQRRSPAEETRWCCVLLRQPMRRVVDSMKQYRLQNAHETWPKHKGIHRS